MFKKKRDNFLLIIGIIILLLGIIVLFYNTKKSNIVNLESRHTNITKELINMVDKSEEQYNNGESKINLKQLLKTSIKKARIINPNKISNPVQSLNEYYYFLDKYEGLYPNFTFEQDITSISGQDILNGVLLFYFIIDQPIQDLKSVIPSNQPHTLQFYEPFSDWLIKYVEKWGAFLDTTDSWNDEVYQKIYNAPSMGMQTGWFGKGNLWRTWNEWFSRVLICPSTSHPISGMYDNSIIISPADSVPQGVWNIDEHSRIGVKNGPSEFQQKSIQLKLLTYYNINDLLKKDSHFINAFAGGTMTHTFLNVSDYHRYHYPISGEVVEYRKIKQHVSLQVKWNKLKQQYDPIDSTGWQFSQTRAYVIIKTSHIGYVALIPMGMATVSSCNITYPMFGHHQKGDELGNFLFGASDFVMVFQKRANFVMTAPKNNNGTYKHILMGQKYGRVNSSNFYN